MAGTSAALRMRRHQLHSPSTHLTVIWMLLLLLLPLLAAAPTSSSSSSSSASTSASSSASATDRRRCAHKGIAELIRTSPVIVKALAARIFTDAELSDDATFTSTSTEGATILITLTPETIYKGASLLKMPNGAPAANGGILTADGGVGGFGSETRRNSYGGFSGSSGWSGSAGTESPYQYEGQLNATLQPLQCFDANMLKMLPTELIAFGKLLPASASFAAVDGTSGSAFASGSASVADSTGTDFLSDSGSISMTSRRMERPALGSDVDKDILHISVNGLHRWTPQFEHHIWKHLGWDDWSDFTLCSVTCGKGVQQRFRRCLLDNPMVDMGMNMNLNLSLDDDDDDEEIVEVADMEEVLLGDEQEEQQTEVFADEANNDVSSAPAAATTTTTTTATNTITFNADSNEVLGNEPESEKQQNRKAMLMMQPADVLRKPLNKLSHKFTQTPAIPSSTYPALHATAGLTSVGNEPTANGTGVSFMPLPAPAPAPATAPARNGHRRTRAYNQHKKKRKSAKSVALSTLLCEGYNIEQRNCNSFECSDDISDLLKFYKKLPISAVEELPPIVSINESVSSFAEQPDLTTRAVEQPASSTPSNMGYVRSWRNMLNFTLMITLRAKNDTKNTSTIFSIRNVTHNLYLEACKDGLRLYLERDNTTEMLPVKFNLYDYRWHQVAISIQNGDFISIYVDCSWTNSFVVSKRLFTLPLDADVEIGRGFNGELQQLLVLPEHQERLQCSNKRTSINEVKRYIIDTFIEDYGNN